jgi:hypothetical protein
MKRLTAFIAAALFAASAFAATSVDDDKTGIPTGGGGSGTVSSVAASGANGIAVTGSPITGTGTLALSLGDITPTTVSTGTGTFSGRLATSDVVLGSIFRIGNLAQTTNYVYANNDYVSLHANAGLQWTSAANNAAFTADVLLSRDAAGVLAQRNGTNAQGFRLYNTYTDASNYERLGIRWASNILTISNENAGTGSSRNMQVGDSSTNMFFDGNGLTATGGRLTPGSDDGVTLGHTNRGWRRLYVGYTNTATVGAVTINKAAGRVNVAAAGSSIVVTNSYATAAAKVFASVCNNDATAYVKNTIPASGSFTITLGAAATAQTCIDFFIVNTD